LHGTQLNYGRKVVTVKALCILAALVEWEIDTANLSNDENKRIKYNTEFLKNIVAKLNSTSPEDALLLLQNAFEKNKPHEVVGLIDYDPIVTVLRSKLSEWGALMDATSIRIVRKGEWAIFGTAGSSEQEASCDIELILRQGEDSAELRSDQKLYARRQAQMRELGLGHVWQIQLPILGAIRSKLSLIEKEP
jgi:hypothetical protein